MSVEKRVGLLFVLPLAGALIAFALAGAHYDVCMPWGPGTYLTVYAIRNDGTVLTWGHGIDGTGTFELVISPFVGGFVGLMAAIVIVVGIWASGPSAPSTGPASHRG